MKTIFMDFKDWEMGIPFFFGWSSVNSFHQEDAEEGENEYVRDHEQVPPRILKQIHAENPNEGDLPYFHNIGWIASYFFDRNRYHSGVKQKDGKWIKDHSTGSMMTNEEAYDKFIRNSFFETIGAKSQHLWGDDMEWDSPKLWKDWIIVIKDLHWSYQLFNELDIPNKEKLIQEDYFGDHFYSAPYEFKEILEKMDDATKKDLLCISKKTTTDDDLKEMRKAFEMDGSSWREIETTFVVFFSQKVPMASYYVYDEYTIDEEFLKDTILDLGYHVIEWENIHDSIPEKFEKYGYKSYWEAFF